MGNAEKLIFAATLGLTAPAFAGPCSDQIAQLARNLSQHPNVSGSPTTGTLNGSGPGSATQNAQADTSGQAQATSEKGQTRLNGESGNREMNATASNIATSPADVRRQQSGEPTMADNPNAPSPDARVAQAEQQLDRARALDAANDSACHAAADKASQLAGNPKG